MTDRPQDLTELLVLLGTDHHPFDRLVRWVDGWVQANPGRVSCSMQIGPSTEPSASSSVALMSRGLLDAHLEAADIVVCHGGPGTIADARRFARRPIVVPRRADLGEHVDDHQVRWARFLARAGEIDLAEDRPTLEELLSAALADPARARLAHSESVDPMPAVRRFAEIVDPLLDGRRR